MKVRLRHIVVVGFLLAFAQFLIAYMNWYEVYPWADIPMHIFGGFVVGLMWVWVLQVWKKPVGKVEIMSILGFVLLGGLAWELFEIFCWKFLSHYLDFARAYVPDVVDLTADLVNDTIGGLLAAFMYWWKS